MDITRKFRFFEKIILPLKSLNFDVDSINLRAEKSMIMFGDRFHIISLQISPFQLSGELLSKVSDEIILNNEATRTKTCSKSGQLHVVLTFLKPKIYKMLKRKKVSDLNKLMFLHFKAFSLNILICTNNCNFSRPNQPIK